MNYKCPFCKSTNTEEISKPVVPYMPINNGLTGYTAYDYDDGCIEYACRDCGQVSKVDPHYYKEESTNHAQQEQNESENKDE